VRLGLFAWFGLAASVALAQTSFSTAQVITGQWGSVTNDNTGIVPDTGGPSHAGFLPQHPLWYSRVLAQRLLAILRDASPASLTVGGWTFGVPGAGWLLPPGLLLAAWRRRRFELLLLLFTLPLSALAVLVYSGRGMTLYGIAHLLALAVVLDALAGAWRMRHGSPVPASHPGVS